MLVVIAGLSHALRSPDRPLIVPSEPRWGQRRHWATRASFNATASFEFGAQRAEHPPGKHLLMDSDCPPEGSEFQAIKPVCVGDQSVKPPVWVAESVLRVGCSERAAVARGGEA